MTTTPYHWIKRVQETLGEIEAIPLWGAPPSFPWETCVQSLKEKLQLKEIALSPHKTEWLSYEEIQSGFGNQPLLLPIELTPLVGSAYWIMSQEDATKLLSFTISQDQKTKSFSDPHLAEGYYRFLCLEAMAAIDQLKAFGDLSLKIGSSSFLPHEGALCVDVRLSFPGTVLWGRIVCPSSFHSSFKSHFAQVTPPLLSSELAKEVEVSLRLEIGSTVLNLPQWENVTPGDLLLLDRCTFDPKTRKGTVTIVLEQTPLFRARCKEDTLKILDYVFYYEEENTMKGSNPGDDQDDEFLEDEENEITSSDEEDSEEESEEESLEKANHLWSPKNEEELSVEKLITKEEIPITLTVEISRIKISVEKLLQMEPGNLIELSVRPEQGVYLTVQGKRIAKGELVHLGETLGVKILELK